MSFSVGVINIKKKLIPINGSQYSHMNGTWLFWTNQANNALYAFDTTDLGDTTVYSVSGVNGAQDFAIKGNYAYVGGFTNNRLYVIDISDPTSMSIVTSYNVGSVWLQGIRIIGNTVFGSTDFQNHVYSYDITTATSPSAISSIITGSAKDIANLEKDDGSNVYGIPTQNGTLYVYDVSNPASMSLLTSLSMGSAGAYRFVRYDPTLDYIFVRGGTSNSVHAIDVSSPGSLSISNTWAPTDYTKFSDISVGTTIYFPFNDGLYSIDHADIGAMSSSFNTHSELGPMGGLHSDGTYIYSIDANYLNFVRISSL